MPALKQKTIEKSLDEAKIRKTKSATGDLRVEIMVADDKLDGDGERWNDEGLPTLIPFFREGVPLLPDHTNPFDFGLSYDAHIEKLSDPETDEEVSECWAHFLLDRDRHESGKVASPEWKGGASLKAKIKYQVVDGVKTFTKATKVEHTACTVPGTAAVGSSRTRLSAQIEKMKRETTEEEEGEDDMPKEDDGIAATLQKSLNSAEAKNREYETTISKLKGEKAEGELELTKTRKELEDFKTAAKTREEAAIKHRFDELEKSIQKTFGANSEWTKKLASAKKVYLADRESGEEFVQMIEKACKAGPEKAKPGEKKVDLGVGDSGEKTIEKQRQDKLQLKVEAYEADGWSTKTAEDGFSFTAEKGQQKATVKV